MYNYGKKRVVGKLALKIILKAKVMFDSIITKLKASGSTQNHE